MEWGGIAIHPESACALEGGGGGGGDMVGGGCGDGTVPPSSLAEEVASGKDGKRETC